MRDLLGTPQRPARELPGDDSTFGFDTIADTLALSPLLFEKLDVAALRLARSLRGGPSALGPRARDAALVLPVELRARRRARRARGLGPLRDPATLAARVARMLRDPRFERFVDDFAGQWLATRALDDVNPHYPYLASWDDALAEALRQETHRFVRDLMQSDGSFLALLGAGFTYPNDRLAAHCGLPAPGTSEMVRVELAPHATRGGILTHGSLHAVTSFPRRSSPVKRGKLVLDQLLCLEIDPPPAGVEGFLTDPNRVTLRDQLARHRADPARASCHAYLDPIGLAVEDYGPIGGWRSTDAQGAIDASGALPDGRSFADARELAALLEAGPRTARCIVERVLVYALGRGLRPSDAPHLDAIEAAFAASGHRFESLLVAIAQSPPFAMRRGQAEEGTPREDAASRDAPSCAAPAPRSRCPSSTR